MMKDYVIPIVVLAAICLFVSGALAAVNHITEPVITQAEAERAEEARKRIIPEADEFIQLVIEELPEGNAVREVYGTSNDVGFIFVVSPKGYNGNIEIMCGIDPEGRIIMTETLKHAETKGISDPVFAAQDRYKGEDSSLGGIDAISGATKSFLAYRKGISDAFEVFEIVMGVQ